MLRNAASTGSKGKTGQGKGKTGQGKRKALPLLYTDRSMGGTCRVW